MTHPSIALKQLGSCSIYGNFTYLPTKNKNEEKSSMIKFDTGVIVKMPVQIDYKASIMSYKNKNGMVITQGYNLNDAEIFGCKSYDKMKFYGCSNIIVDTSNDGDVPDEVYLINKEPCDCENKSILGNNDYCKIEQNVKNKQIITKIKKR